MVRTKRGIESEAEKKGSTDKKNCNNCERGKLPEAKGGMEKQQSASEMGVKQGDDRG